jgi:hypothetical protein
MRNRADMNLIVPAPPPAASLRREVSPPEPYMTAPAQLAAAPPTASGSVASEQAAGTPAAAPFAKMAASRATDATSPARVKDSGPLPVPDWIALIRRLRDEGQTAEAAKELAAFRTAHADHEKLLPPDLRDWHQK